MFLQVKPYSYSIKILPLPFYYMFMKDNRTLHLDIYLPFVQLCIYSSHP